MADQIAFNQPCDELSPLLSKDEDTEANVYAKQPGLRGSFTAETESINTTSKSAFVSGVGSIPQGGSLLTLPRGTSASLNGDDSPLGMGLIHQETEVQGHPLAKNDPNHDIETPYPERRRDAEATEMALPRTAVQIRTGPQETGMEQMMKLCKRNWKPSLITVLAVSFVLLVTGAIIVALKVTDPCKNLNITSSVFTNDTILVANSSDSKFCGKRPTIFIPNYKTDEQPVHIYETDCNALKWYQTNFTLDLQRRVDRKSPLTLFSQYLTEGAHVILKLNVTVRIEVGNEIFVCVFDDVEFYTKNFDLNDHWRNATSAALQCSHRNVTNQTVSFDNTLLFNKTSYYFIGIAGTQQIDLIQWSYEGSTGVLNHNNYKDSELKCMVSNGCIPTEACVIAYAEPPANGRYSFSSVRTVEEKTALTTRSIASIIVGSVALLVMVMIVFSGGRCCYHLYNR